MCTMTDKQFEEFCKVLAEAFGKKKSAEVWWIRGGITVVCALLISGVVGVINMNKTQVVQGVQMQHMQQDVANLRADIRNGMDDRYRGTDAKADLLIRDKAITELDMRVRQLAAEFRAHENLPAHDVVGSAVEALRERVLRLEESADKD